MMYGTVFAGAVAFVVSPAMGQEEKHADHGDKHGAHDGQEGHGEQAGGDDAAMTAEFMKLTSPGEHHKKLQPFVGSWKTVTKWRMAEESPWMTSEGASIFKWVLGGRFLVENITGQAMGMPFQGLSHVGYDNFRKEYVGTWMDSLGTAVITYRGSADASGKVFTYRGTMDEPMTGKKDVPYKIVNRVVNENKVVMEMWMPGPDGKEFQNMEIAYTRQ